MPIAEVARQLGIHLETLRNWRRKARASGGQAATTVPSLEEESRRLRRENARLLKGSRSKKGATAFFATMRDEIRVIRAHERIFHIGVLSRALEVSRPGSTIGAHSHSRSD